MPECSAAGSRVMEVSSPECRPIPFIWHAERIVFWNMALPLVCEPLVCESPPGFIFLVSNNFGMGLSIPSDYCFCFCFLRAWRSRNCSDPNFAETFTPGVSCWSGLLPEFTPSANALPSAFHRLHFAENRLRFAEIPPFEVFCPGNSNHFMGYNCK